jgi:hypothetical protein
MISSNKEVAETQLAQKKEVAETRVSQNKEAFVKVLSTVKDMRDKQSKLTDLVMDSARKSRSDGLPSMIDIGGITPAKLFDGGVDIGHPPTPFDQKKYDDVFKKSPFEFSPFDSSEVTSFPPLHVAQTIPPLPAAYTRARAASASVGGPPVIPPEPEYGIGGPPLPAAMEDDDL